MNAGKGFYRENSLVLQQIGRALGLVDGILNPWRHPATAEPGGEGFVKTTALYLNNLESLRVLCEASGTTFVPVTFLADTDHLAPPYDTGIELYVNALRQRWKHRSTPLIDLVPLFTAVENKGDLFFEDRYHPNRSGAAFLAEHVGVALEPLIARSRSTAAANDFATAPIAHPPAAGS